jgi:hypothetical protein
MQRVKSLFKRLEGKRLEGFPKGAIRRVARANTDICPSLGVPGVLAVRSKLN